MSGPLAQRLEQRTHNPLVLSSNLRWPRRHSAVLSVFFLRAFFACTLHFMQYTFCMKCKKFLVLFLIICAGFFSCDAPGNGEGAKASSYDMQIFDLVNKHRQSKGLAALQWDDAIYQQCYNHSEAMANGSTAFGHDGFSSRCDKIKPWSWAGENVAVNYSTKPHDVVNQWLNSPEHKANIEKDSATHSAVCAVQRSGKGWYYTQIFITRK